MRELLIARSICPARVLTPASFDNKINRYKFCDCWKSGTLLPHLAHHTPKLVHSILWIMGPENSSFQTFLDSSRKLIRILWGPIVLLEICVVSNSLKRFQQRMCDFRVVSTRLETSASVITHVDFRKPLFPLNITKEVSGII